MSLIPAGPYLLFVADGRGTKTAEGLATWKRDECVGQIGWGQSCIDLPFLTLETARSRGARCLIVGVANGGGVMEDRWLGTLLKALELGYDLVSGLHTRLSAVPALRDTANRFGRRILDIRRPDTTFAPGSGERRTGRRLLTVGTDCAVGKMFTALSLARRMKERGLHCTFRATGQTGVLIAGAGVCVDAVPGDFMAGAIEALTPPAAPSHWDVIEGQGSLSHPAYAGVSLALLHGAQPDAIVVCHRPDRLTMVGTRRPLPSLQETCELNERLARATNSAARIAGISLNTSQLDTESADALARAVQAQHGYPCVDPARHGVDPIVDALAVAQQFTS